MQEILKPRCPGGLGKARNQRLLDETGGIAWDWDCMK